VSGRALLVIAAATALAGCVGTLEDGPAGPGGSRRDQPDPGPREPVASCPDGDALGRRVIRRLTGPELDVTLRHAFELDASAWSGPTVPPDAASGDGFTGDVDRLRVNETYASRLLETGREVARVVSAEPRLSGLLPCAAAGDEACARTFVESVGRRLFRRAPTELELERYLDAYRRLAPSAGFAAWVRIATIALVQSPHVVWRSEIGRDAGDGTVRLEGWELATQLAYAYSGGPPDDALIAAAQRGELDDDEGVRAAARALVWGEAGEVRPAFRGVALRFFEQWLGLSALPNASKDPVLYPDFSPAVRDAMRREIDAYVGDVVLARREGVGALLTSERTFVDATLASYYGFGAAAGETMVETERPAGWGAGLLAQGAWLAIQSNAQITSPTRRGHFVRGRLLCQDVPPPPPTAGPLPEVEIGSVSTRERYERLHASSEACAGCHTLMDPIGFGLEHLDAAGRRRETEGRFEIDDRGVVSGTSRGDLEVEGAAELAAALAELPEVESCVASWVARHAYGVDRHEATCLAASARPALTSEDGSFVDHWIALAATRHFTHRAP
jgi:hypothetical protein